MSWLSRLTQSPWSNFVFACIWVGIATSWSHQLSTTSADDWWWAFAAAVLGQIMVWLQLGLWVRGLKRKRDVATLWLVFTDWLRELATAYVNKREPDQYIGGREDPYLLRWYLTPWRTIDNIRPEERTRWQKFLWFLRLPCVYVHLFLRSDDDRALHDHPWANCSIVLAGNYWEHRAHPEPDRLLRVRGDLVTRWAKTAHRIELIPFPGGKRGLAPALTLFITGFKTRTWGFHCPRGWVPWREYTAASDTGTIGRGCD